MNVPLVTHILNGLIRWTNEDQPGLGTFLRKCRVLTQLVSSSELASHRNLEVHSELTKP